MRKPGRNHEQKGCQPSWLMLEDVGRSLPWFFGHFVPIGRDRVVVLARDACILGYIHCRWRAKRRSRSATSTVRASTATATVVAGHLLVFYLTSYNALTTHHSSHNRHTQKKNTTELSHKNTLGREVLNITPILPSFAAINPDFRLQHRKSRRLHSLFRWSTMTLPPELVNIIVERLPLVPLFWLRRTCRREDGWISTTTAILRDFETSTCFKATNTAALLVQTVPWLMSHFMLSYSELKSCCTWDHC